MAWDWEDTGKGLVSVFIIWLVNYLWKRSKPILEAAKRIANYGKITKQLELDLAVEKSKLSALLDISPHPIYIINDEGEMVYANQSWVDKMGFKDESEAYGLGYLRGVHPEDRAEVSNQRKLLAKTTSSYNGRVRFRNLSSHEDITMTCVSRNYKDNTGKVVGTIGTLY